MKNSTRRLKYAGREKEFNCVPDSFSRNGRFYKITGNSCRVYRVSKGKGGWQANPTSSPGPFKTLLLALGDVGFSEKRTAMLLNAHLTTDNQAIIEQCLGLLSTDNPSEIPTTIIERQRNFMVLLNERTALCERLGLFPEATFENIKHAINRRGERKTFEDEISRLKSNSITYMSDIGSLQNKLAYMTDHADQIPSLKSTIHDLKTTVSTLEKVIKDAINDEH